MSDPQNDADKIRLKRLATLQKQQEAAAASAAASASSSVPSISSTSPSNTAQSQQNAAQTSSTGSPAVAAKAAPSASPSVQSSTPSSSTLHDSASVSRTSTPSQPKASLSKPASGSLASSQHSNALTPSKSSSATPITKPGLRGAAEGRGAPASGSSSAATAALQIPFPLWYSGMISRIFGFTLSQARAEASSWSITFLYNLCREVLSEIGADADQATKDAALRFDEDNLERAIVARLSMDPESMSDLEDEDGGEESEEYAAVKVTVLANLPAKMTNLEYLVQCWKKWPIERNKFNAIKGHGEEVSKRIKALDIAKRKILENIGLQLQEPELFPQPSGKSLGGAELLPPLLQMERYPASPLLSLEPHQVLSLLSDIAATYSTPTSSADLVDVLGTPFVQRLVDVLGARESSLQAIIAAMNPNQPQSSNILDLTGLEWRNVIRSLNDCTDIKPIANMFVEMPNWCPPSAPAQTFEIESTLGPMLRLGSSPDAFIARTYFSEPSALSREAIQASSNALRNTLSSLQTFQFSIFNSIVRSSPNSREGVLRYFSHILKINNKRDGMQVDRRTVASDSFMLNSLSVLIDFAAPFMDAKYEKIDKIDPDYFQKCRGRMDIKDMTKMHADLQRAKEYYKDYQIDTSKPPPNFISEIFFLATGFFHYALNPSLGLHRELHRSLHHLREELKEAEANRQYDGTPQEVVWKQQIAKMKAQLESLHSTILAMEVQLLDSSFIAKSANFANFVMNWLVRLVDPKGQHPVQTISLDGLPEQTPVVFSMLPEFLVEDVTEFYFSISRYAPQAMIELPKDALLVFIVTFLCTPYVNNPYLKGKFVDILFQNTRSWGPRFPRGVLGDTLNYHPLALKGLLPALMRVYSEIEFTGQHNQFYEKFEVRHQIAKILKLTWDTKEHRTAFRAETSKEEFIRFVNFLLNDTTFLLDEALSKLKTIHDIQQEMADKAAWLALTEEQRKDRKKLLRAAESQATTFLIYSYEVLYLLKTLTAESPEPFLKGEIVDRLAASLDFNLNVLAGPRCQELRVQDREKYHFRPRELLGDIMQVIMNLANKDTYVVATAKDGRSYSKALFDNAVRIATRAGIKAEHEVQVLRRMVDKIEEIKLAEAEEEELGETPDEYLDPLTAEIMVDPVILPASGTTIDFNTIKQHLLTVEQDPFNRTPLKIQDVKRNDALREEIEAFRAKRRQERLDRLAAAQSNAEGGAPAPTAAGGDVEMQA